MFGPLINSYGGFSIIEDTSMVDPYEDWSRVRSPGRAARRRNKHKQNIVIRYKPKSDIYQVGNKLIMHPEMAKEFKQRIPNV